MLDKLFFTKLGIKVRNDVRERIFEKGKDVKDNKFKPYTSSQYRSRKFGGKLKRQAGDAKTNAPYVTGDLKRDLTVVRPTNNSVQVGWTKSGGKIKALNKLGRLITTSGQPFQQKTINMIMREAKLYTDKKVKAKFPKGKVIRLPIGRK